MENVLAWDMKMQQNKKWPYFWREAIENKVIIY